MARWSCSAWFSELFQEQPLPKTDLTPQLENGGDGEIMSEPASASHFASVACQAGLPTVVDLWAISWNPVDFPLLELVLASGRK